ncbi:MAG TPA: riboflavin transporter, partial [Fervidobacterium sp.]|nr:riboflavin transporter [Fervidobacterium sp.]
ITMDFIAGVAYVLPVLYIYRVRKNRAFEILGYIVGVLVVSGVMTLLNMFVVPVYWKIPFAETLKLLPWIAGFNVLKFTINSIVNGLVRVRITKIFEN